MKHKFMTGASKKYSACQILKRKAGGVSRICRALSQAADMSQPDIPPLGAQKRSNTCKHISTK
jgi:hypothetical protein